MMLNLGKPKEALIKGRKRKVVKFAWFPTVVTDSWDSRYLIWLDNYNAIQQVLNVAGFNVFTGERKYKYDWVTVKKYLIESSIDD